MQKKVAMRIFKKSMEQSALRSFLLASFDVRKTAILKEKIKIFPQNQPKINSKKVVKKSGFFLPFIKS